MRRTFLLVATLATAGCAGPDGELASLARQRLALAPEIAWYKHSNNLPVYDPVRENTLLETVIAEGRAAGLDRETVRRFFSAEMEASRRIQWAWIEGWRKGRLPPGTHPRDLPSDLRPRIDHINQHQIDALSRGARPLGVHQLSLIGERFLPKKPLSSPAASSASTPPVSAQR